MKPEFPIVIVKGGAFDDALGVRGYPTKAVVSPDGILTYAGYDEGEALENAMSSATKGSFIPKIVDKVRKLMSSGKRDKAYAEVLSILEKGKAKTDEDRFWVESYQGSIEAGVASDVELARTEFDEGRAYLAVELLEEITKSKMIYPAREAALLLLQEVEAMPNFKDEMKGGKAYAKARTYGDEREFEDYAKAMISVSKKYDGTRIGERALKDAQDVIDRGLPGMRSSCPGCAERKKACVKHAVEIKQ